MKRNVKQEEAIPLGGERAIGSWVLVSGRRMKITAVDPKAGTVTAED